MIEKFNFITRPIVGSYSTLGLLNILVLQWLFVRLQATVNGSKLLRLELIGFILPMTGWFNDYIYVWKFNPPKTTVKPRR
jgi:hypothetical protein